MRYRFLGLCLIAVTARALYRPAPVHAKPAPAPKIEAMSIPALRIELTRLQLERQQALHTYFPTSQYVRRIEQKIARVRQRLDHLEQNERRHPGVFMPPSIIFCQTKHETR